MLRLITTFMLAASLLVSGPAFATQFLYTITGAITGEELSFDERGIFSFAQGDAFTATFLVDDARPEALYSYDPTGSSAIGGGYLALGTRTPVTSTIAINGNSFSVRTGDFHQYPITDPATGDPIGPTDTIDELGVVSKDTNDHSLQLVSGYDSSHSCCFPAPHDSYGEFEGLEFVLYSGAFTDPDYRQTGTFTLQPGSYGGFFKSDSFAGNPGLFTQILLAANSLTVTRVAAVPEIGTWLMMILGLGVIGVGLRRNGNARALRVRRAES